ncbi:hypothetical protein DL96DRAFT_477936 [Flagelloscypha sp. PMI_526]|nr:hypothetical protein DL96DRAFT_477936 [Flagelloscypha sp. PMI_526]
MQFSTSFLVLAVALLGVSGLPVARQTQQPQFKDPIGQCAADTNACALNFDLAQAADNACVTGSFNSPIPDCEKIPRFDCTLAKRQTRVAADTSAITQCAADLDACAGNQQLMIDAEKACENSGLSLNQADALGCSDVPRPFRNDFGCVAVP